MAKQLLHVLDCPLVVNLKSIIKTNAIQDNPITESNVELMEHLFRPDIPTIKGKTTRQCPHQLVSNVVSIPHELCDAQCDECLYIDIMYVNGMPFLTTISKNIKYVLHCNVGCRLQCSHNSSLVESVLKLCQWAGFQVMEVCADHKFKPVLQASKMMDGPS